mmetsp:Transcript_27555/g.40508  ORF Transcript_27555/g.40508 Transcript_27555/m.40508 type:complete len:263 (-) Transcript_27555:26-814(-)
MDLRFHHGCPNRRFCRCLTGLRHNRTALFRILLPCWSAKHATRHNSILRRRFFIGVTTKRLDKCRLGSILQIKRTPHMQIHTHVLVFWPHSCRDIALLQNNAQQRTFGVFVGERRYLGKACIDKCSHQGLNNVISVRKVQSSIFSFHNHENAWTALLVDWLWFLRCILFFAQVNGRGVAAIVVDIFMTIINVSELTNIQVWSAVVVLSESVVQKVNFVASQNQTLGANYRDVGIMDLKTVVKDLCHLFHVQFVLDKNTFRFE